MHGYHVLHKILQLRIQLIVLSKYTLMIPATIPYAILCCPFLAILTFYAHESPSLLHSPLDDLSFPRCSHARRAPTYYQTPYSNLYPVKIIEFWCPNNILLHELSSSIVIISSITYNHHDISS